jgi:hypothetical protein
MYYYKNNPLLESNLGTNPLVFYHLVVYLIADAVEYGGKNRTLQRLGGCTLVHATLENTSLVVEVSLDYSFRL